MSHDKGKVLEETRKELRQMVDESFKWQRKLNICPSIGLRMLQALKT